MWDDSPLRICLVRWEVEIILREHGADTTSQLCNFQGFADGGIQNAEDLEEYMLAEAGKGSGEGAPNLARALGNDLEAIRRSRS